MIRRMQLASLVSVLLAVGTVSAYAQVCTVDLVLLNQARRVAGEISEECGNVHDAPFGNWGVRLNFHSAVGAGGGGDDETLEKRDRFQFSGWKAKSGWLQWNSCTAGADYLPPDQRYYNDNGFHTQKASPDIVNVSHSFTGFAEGEQGTPCKEVFSRKNIVVRNVEMEVFELDPLWWDGQVATLGYGDVKVQYSCDDPWRCYGESDWISPQLDNQKRRGPAANRRASTKRVTGDGGLPRPLRPPGGAERGASPARGC